MPTTVVAPRGTGGHVSQALFCLLISSKFLKKMLGLSSGLSKIVILVCQPKGVVI